jgi:hypothetical protein
MMRRALAVRQRVDRRKPTVARVAARRSGARLPPGAACPGARRITARRRVSIDGTRARGDCAAAGSRAGAPRRLAVDHVPARPDTAAARAGCVASHSAAGIPVELQEAIPVIQRRRMRASVDQL